MKRENSSSTLIFKNRGEQSGEQIHKRDEGKARKARPKLAKVGAGAFFVVEPLSKAPF